MRSFVAGIAGLTMASVIACGSDGGASSGPVDAATPIADAAPPPALDAARDADADADAAVVIPTRGYTRAWTFTFSSAARTGSPVQTSFEGVKAIALDEAANVYVGAGGRSIASTTSVDDWWLKKLDPTGHEITTGWDKVIDDSLTYDEIPRAASKLRNGSILFAGQIGAEPGAEYSDHGTFRCFAPDGTEVPSWASYVGVGETTAALVEAPSGVVYALMAQKTDLFTTTSTRVRRFDATGALDPSFAVEHGSYDPIQSIAVDKDGNVFLGGVSQALVGDTSKDAWIAKYDATGTLAWNHAITLAQAGTMRSVLVVGDEVLGFAVDEGESTTERTVMPYELARTDGAARQESWQPYTYKGAFRTTTVSPMLDNDGNIEALVADPGSVASTSTFRLRRFAPNGTTLSLSSALVETYGVTSFAIVPNGDVVLAGDSSVVGYGDELKDTAYVLKMTPSP